jgi:hypothetical protein
MHRTSRGTAVFHSTPDNKHYSKRVQWRMLWPALAIVVLATGAGAWPSTPVCHTIAGGLCTFPFKLDGRTFDNCTTYKSENGAAWCATEVLGTTWEPVMGERLECVAPCDNGASPPPSPSPAPPHPALPSPSPLEDNRVFQLNEDGMIDCESDGDCPSIAEKVEAEATATELKVRFTVGCSGTCLTNAGAFCEHPLGENDPECLRCKTSRPNPPCYLFGSDSEQARSCCNDIDSGVHGDISALFPAFNLGECLACSHYSSAYSDPRDASAQCAKWLEVNNPCSFFGQAIAAFPLDVSSSLGGLSAARLQNLSTRRRSGQCATRQCRARDAQRPRAGRSK